MQKDSSCAWSENKNTDTCLASARFSFPNTGGIPISRKTLSARKAWAFPDAVSTLGLGELLYANPTAGAKQATTGQNDHGAEQWPIRAEYIYGFRRPVVIILSTPTGIGGRALRFNAPSPPASIKGRKWLGWN